MVMLSLSEVLESDGVLLLDGSLQNHGRMQHFCWEIYESEDTKQISSESMASAERGIEYLIAIFEHSNTRTIKEAIDEIRKLHVIIGDKIKYVSKNKSSSKKDYELKNLQQRAFDLWRIARQKELNKNQFGINPRAYGLLLEMVKRINKAIKLKKDTSFMYGQRDRDVSEQIDTDERLVASLYCLCLYHDKNPAILSSDTDFIRLLGVTPKIMGSDVFLPYNQEFRQAIQQNPFRLYFKQVGEENYEMSVDSSEISFSSGFIINSASKERNELIKNEILELWKQFKL